jgi:enhanced disease susceptibility 1 protein
MVRGLFGDNIGLNEEVIKKTCSLSFKAHKSPNQPYISENFKTSSELTEYLVISFPGSWVETDWFVRKPFGETKIDLAQFPLLKSVGNDETALVNEAFLNRFDRLLKFSSIISEVCNPVIFHLLHLSYDKCFIFAQFLLLMKMISCIDFNDKMSFVY